MKQFPFAVIRLFLSSFVCITGRAAALPFMALYLTQQFQLDQQVVGWILGGSIFCSTLFGIYGGYLADRFDKHRLMAFACIIVAAACLLATFTSWAWLVFVCLALIEAALVLRSISLKALMAELLSVEKRPAAFAMNYTLINVAFSIGPLLGAWSFGLNMSAPLWIAAAAAVLATPIVGARPRNFSEGSAATQAYTILVKPLDFKATLIDLKNDRRLVFFTLGSVLTQLVFGRFVSGYIAQYLIVSQGVQAAADLAPYILMTNAMGVVLFQYPVGKHIKQQYLFPCVALGASLYAAGLLGFMHATTIFSWVIATLIFTVGEVIVIPSEYMFIDMIAPPEKRGSYYGAQGLSAFGAAINPILCGFLLHHFSSDVMFWTLIASALSGVLMYRAGTKACAPQECRTSSQMANCAE